MHSKIEKMELEMKNLEKEHKRLQTEHQKLKEDHKDLMDKAEFLEAQQTKSGSALEKMSLQVVQLESILKEKEHELLSQVSV